MARPSTNREAANARIVVLVKPSEKQQLLDRAGEAGYESLGAYVRNRMLGSGPDQRQATADILVPSRKRAMRELDKALRALEAHDAIAAERTTAAIAAATEEWAHWPDSRKAALANLLAGGTEPQP